MIASYATENLTLVNGWDTTHPIYVPVVRVSSLSPNTSDAVIELPHRVFRDVLLFAEDSFENDVSLAGTENGGLIEGVGVMKMVRYNEPWVQINYGDGVIQFRLVEIEAILKAIDTLEGKAFDTLEGKA